MLVGLIGEVNDEMLTILSQQLIQAAINRDEVTIIISTYGGEVYPALGMYDMIKHHPHKTTTIAIGPCFSAGMIILQAGQKRAMTKNAVLMTHYGESGSGSEGDAKQNDKLHKQHKDMVGSKVKVSQRVVNNWFKQETYFDADQALKVGLVDEVVDDAKANS